MGKRSLKILNSFVFFWYTLNFSILCWGYFFYIPDYCLNISNYFCDTTYQWIPIALLISGFFMFLSIVLKMNKKNGVEK